MRAASPDPVWDPNAAKPYWRAVFVIEAGDVATLVELLDDEALAVSFFEDAADEDEETVSWRVELLFAAKPNKRELKNRLDRILAQDGLATDNVAVERVDHDLWLETLNTPRAPIEIGRFYVHGAKWEADPPASSVPILMDAGMAFGSGEHATTRACLQTIDWLAERRTCRRVLDLGCGSGLLGIAAAKVWRCRVLATDIDPVAVAVANANIALNNVELNARAAIADGYSDPAIKRAAPFDLIVANILAGPLIDMAFGLRRHLAPDGYAILSGLLDRQVEAVLDAHRPRGFHIVRRFDIPPWAALVLQRRKRWRSPPRQAVSGKSL